MLLTITYTGQPATDLGYLLHKSPFRIHSFEQVFGKTHVFYPEAAPNAVLLRWYWILIPLDSCGTDAGRAAKRTS